MKIELPRAKNLRTAQLPLGQTSSKYAPIEVDDVLETDEQLEIWRTPSGRGCGRSPAERPRWLAEPEGMCGEKNRQGILEAGLRAFTGSGRNLRG